MCGIAGVLGSPERTTPLIGPMLDVITHRGPDDFGEYVADRFAFGMRRLSIIDLSGGHQPMWSADDSVGVVFNGEIYNYRELRAQLSAAGQSFQTHSDTETILVGYQAGRDDLPAFFRSLRGMFGLCLYDVERQVLILARDPFGIKPLYYRLDEAAAHPRVRSFGSEIKSLLLDPEYTPAVNEEALLNYLSFQFNPLAETFFSSIHRLDPGCYAVISLADGSIAVDRYWRYEFAEPWEDEHALVAGVRECLEDSVAHHVIADVPVGAFLSGGIDSAITVTLVQEQRRALGQEPVKTFTVGFDAVSEHAQAREVADRLGTDHHEVHVDLHEYLEVLPRIAWYFDEPVADPSAV
ncbi:MAG: asparagine synthase (glutamine-hydrolyzing), partial [Candidatus Nanopelagicales bacterium]